MEKGSGSKQNNGNEGKWKMQTQTVFTSELTNRTIEKILRSRGKYPQKAELITLHDMTSPGYGWLLPGWVAEERHMAKGRIYRVSITLS